MLLFYNISQLIFLHTLSAQSPNPESDVFLHSPAIQTKTCSNHFIYFILFFLNRNFIQVPETTLSKLLDISGVRAGWLEMSCAPQPLEQTCITRPQKTPVRFTLI